MLIVALQDSVDNLFAIWDTVTDRFLGVNLTEEEAIKIIMDKKGCSENEAQIRTKYPQPFSDIARNIMGEFESDADQIIHFFEAEIENCKNRKFGDSEYFNGVPVTCRCAEMLNQAHINYCQNIIDRIRSDSL